VFLILLANITAGTTAEISQTEIARKLDTETSNISRSIRKLCELGIVEKRYLTGKLIGYKLLVEE
jgi:predicted transcriptional regulator